MLPFKTIPVPPAKRRKKPDDERYLGFGKIYSDHMFCMKWSTANGWQQGQFCPYQTLPLAPSALVLHYGQSIFEGLKAYRNRSKGNAVNLFRVHDNAARFNRSAARLDLPQLEEGVFVKAIEGLIMLDRHWVPQTYGTSLYIRPTMIATEPYIGLKSAAEVLFFIISGPVGAYYPEGFNPIRITVNDRFSRAGPGGLGAAKTAANYAASLLAEKNASQRGFAQVLWLDATKRRYIEEVGSMNILFKINGRVITPPPSDTILAGITKDSVLALLKHWQIPCEEYRLSIDEVLEAHANGTLEEVFGAGTAAVITPVSHLEYQDKLYNIGGRSNAEAGPVSLRLFEELTAIHYGNTSDPFGWITPLQEEQALD